MNGNFDYIEDIRVIAFLFSFLETKSFPSDTLDEYICFSYQVYLFIYSCSNLKYEWELRQMANESGQNHERNPIGPEFADEKNLGE